MRSKIECDGDKRKERTNLNRQIKRQEDRDELKQLTIRFVELVSSMHESDVSQKEWIIWNNFETQHLIQELAENTDGIHTVALELLKLSNIVELLNRKIDALVKMI